MDYLIKKLKPSKLTVDWELEKKHNDYKNCVSKSVQQYITEGEISGYEFCLDEKRNFYAALHEKNKIEHDNLLKFYNERVIDL